MKRFLRAFLYGACGAFCFGVPITEDLHTFVRDAAVVPLFLAGIVLSIAAMYQFVQGVYDVSDKRKMRKAAQQASRNALQVSGKE